MNRPLVLFLAILLVGGALITLLYRSVAQDPPSPAAGMVDDLSDAQKALIETESSLSKWLLGLAYASLAGVFGLRGKSAGDERVVERFPLIGCALLILSLYGGFLFHQACLLILTLGPADLLFGNGILLTLQAQFWLLVAGLVVLAAWLFKKPGSGTKIAACLIVAVLSTYPLTADESKPDPVLACVDNWQQDRGELLGSGVAGEAAKLVAELAAREKVTLEGSDLCAFSHSILDELRFSILENDEHAKVASQMAVVVASARQDLASPGYALGDLVKKLVRLSQVWRAPSGLLQVLAQDGRFEIFMSGRFVGVTNWTRRLEPGTYTLWFTQDGVRRREYDRQVTIADDDLVRVEVGERPK